MADQKWTPLEQRLQLSEGKLSPRRRRLLQSVLDHAEDTYYLSSRKLARRYNVDAATIVRTIQVLGYDDYSTFLADLRSHFVTRITQYRVMQATARKHRNIHDQIHYCLQLDRANFEGLEEGVPLERIVALARRLNKARHIVVVGVDFAYSLAWLMAYGLSWLGLHVEAPMGSYGNLHHRARSLGPRDILVAISFGRCLRVSVEAAQTAREQGAWTFGITDAGNSPIAAVCHDHWVVSVTNPIHKASYVAPVAALNALQVACAHLEPKRSLKRLQQIERDEEAAGRWYAPAAPLWEPGRK
ncbi:MAG TPA: MurR/RpiR family transcriptional regulator [Terriglobales bacterium]|nr:MurR/RpiR family transcriptional regulator [Terriglobales bacterium]